MSKVCAAHPRSGQHIHNCAWPVRHQLSMTSSSYMLHSAHQSGRAISGTWQVSRHLPTTTKRTTVSFLATTSHGSLARSIRSSTRANFLLSHGQYLPSNLAGWARHSSLSEEAHRCYHNLHNTCDPSGLIFVCRLLPTGACMYSN